MKETGKFKSCLFFLHIFHKFIYASILLITKTLSHLSLI